MELLPESIQSTQTLALDHTFRERLLSLAVDQLAIAPEQERDLRKVSSASPWSCFPTSARFSCAICFGVCC